MSELQTGDYGEDVGVREGRLTFCAGLMRAGFTQGESQHRPNHCDEQRNRNNDDNIHGEPPNLQV